MQRLRARPAPADEPRARVAREHDRELEGRIESFELAFRMQTAAPEAARHLATRPRRRCKLYGIDEPETRQLRPAVPAGPPVRRARRALRAVSTHSYKWDQHANSEARTTQATRCEVDQPIAGLLTDLKARGLLDDTLVLWGGEFGRTPYAAGRRRPRPQPARLSRCGWPAAA